MEKPKLCIECKWIVPDDNSLAELSKCAHPNNLAPAKIDPVTGNHVPAKPGLFYVFCSTMREGHQEGCCNASGDWWEPKEADDVPTDTLPDMDARAAGDPAHTDLPDDEGVVI